ncbi:V/A-type H+-transporting ATPase subunit C [Granulicatella balaenopterae]|uniref:V/A-type H+-transporting ATPase subunit C n=1 Tax=Granulicatella balaenopterae TaxID=137733 RepID=A0A1H9P6D9_9LACT|nr:V-type ATPase subunit [Granulicatella balaenopterae]SER43758.1 V/A-type H+-transporting ATPase subunit C [Granulicatella balaenopterae]
MNNLAYSGVNTTVRILEDQLLTKDDFETLLKSSSLKEALEYLQKTSYEIDVPDALENKNFEPFLLKGLMQSYDVLTPIMPEERIIEVFSTSYVYHNLKVLLKQKFTGINMEHLLVPIGEYPIETLKQVVETSDSDAVPEIMKEGVRGALEHYENFHRLESADIFMDTYYFRHLRAIEQDLRDSVITDIVNCMIDLENIATLIRASKQDQSRGFMQTVLSSAGTVSKTRLIDTVHEQGWDSLVELFEHVGYTEQLAEIVSVDTKDIKVIQLELLKEEWIYELLKDATFEAFGPFPGLAYLHAKEMEVKNLRLLLVGKDNGFSEEQIRERMRPIYGS